MYFVGIDGGGTKSRLMAVDEEGNQYGPYFGKSTNINSNPAEVVQANIKSLVLEFLQEQGVSWGALSGICIGSAGIDLPQNVLDYERMLRTSGARCPLKAVNDVEIVFESEAKGQPGIVVISGTGSIVFGKDEKKCTVRIGGWGHIVGDEGSGYWIGKEAVRRSLYSYDGREEKTALVPLLEEACKIKRIPDILDIVYTPNINKSVIADFSKLVDQAANEKDAVAIRILEEAAQDLYLMIIAARNKMTLQDDFPVILSGGTILGSQLLYDRVCRKIAPLTKNVKKTHQEPCMGAVYLAQNCIG